MSEPEHNPSTYDAASHSVYQFSAFNGKNEEISLSKYQGKVLLIINVASHCGFTGQYKDLAAIYDKYHPRGFEILAFPCNQFGHQEPGTHEEICSLAEKKYGAKFEIFQKIDVNGPKALPLYRYLKSEIHGLLTDDIKWNFAKFLVDKKGRPRYRFGSSHTPHDCEKDIEKLLQEP